MLASGLLQLFELCKHRRFHRWCWIGIRTLSTKFILSSPEIPAVFQTYPYKVQADRMLNPNLESDNLVQAYLVHIVYLLMF